ncbi:T9SS type A sorting domain-containing protein [Portibacter lacus]|uniref:Secretion system C-terminal sorting domain-containing protein n=1 Tax=Portibacter lacus TaxID=1099794 RepID=A0AA37SRS9_9BACT|nr:T9SS type A sorting domain-containing protein [Portibacter lacus]GLR16820.1 hypothetical protein GCM10007940_14350 [Portibacter lacus]
MKITPLLTSITFCLSLLSLYGQPGTLRTDFGEDGIFTLDLTDDDEIQDLALLSDGSIVACGYLYDNTYDGIIMRVSASGELIWSKQVEINTNNSTTNDFQGVVVRNDEIFVVGTNFNLSTSKVEIVVLKYDIDGNLIMDFGNNGKTTAVLNNGLLGFELAIDNEGNLFVFGRTYVFNTATEDGVIVKFKANGDLDNSFGENGISTIGIGSFRTGFLEGTIINNEIYAVGWFHNTADAVSINENGVIVKLKEDGSLDLDFGSNGIIVFDVSNSDIIDDIAQHGENHFLVAGSGGVSSDDIYIFRYDLMGQLDMDFGNNGKVVLDYGSDDDAAEILVREDMGIFVCASLNSIEDFAVISMDASGTPYTTFGDNGKIVIDIKNNDNVSEGILLPNGDILLGGESDEGNNADFTLVKIEGYPVCTDIEVTMDISGCEIVEFDGIQYNQSGTYNLDYQSADGCDSTIFLVVKINNASQETVSLSDCSPIVVNDETYVMSGTYTQNLSAENGCDSTLTLNIEINSTTQETISVRACESSTINDETYDSSGSFTQILTGSNGCDSILTLNIDIENLEASITEDENGMLVSNSDANQYQWYNCVTNMIISGEESSAFTPTETGDYALIISSEMCADTSECLAITISETEDLSSLAAISLFPNPAHSYLLIKNIDLNNISKVNLYNLSGLALSPQLKETGQGLKLDVATLISGLYYLKIFDDSGNHKILAFVKE